MSRKFQTIDIVIRVAFHLSHKTFASTLISLTLEFFITFSRFSCYLGVNVFEASRTIVNKAGY